MIFIYNIYVLWMCAHPFTDSAVAPKELALTRYSPAALGGRVQGLVRDTLLWCNHTTFGGREEQVSEEKRRPHMICLMMRVKHKFSCQAAIEVR